MATTEAEALLKQLLAEEPRAVSSAAFYSPDGDCIFYYAKKGPHDGVRMDGLFTVYLTRGDRQFAGFQVKGVRAFMEELRKAVTSAKNEVELRDLLIDALERATGDPKKFTPIEDR